MTLFKFFFVISLIYLPVVGFSRGSLWFYSNSCILTHICMYTFSTLKIPRGNILYIPFCTFPFSFRSTFWRIKEYLISAHLYLIFSHGILEFIVHTIINHFPSSWKCRFFSLIFITNSVVVDILILVLLHKINYVGRKIS